MKHKPDTTPHTYHIEISQSDKTIYSSKSYELPYEQALKTWNETMHELKTSELSHLSLIDHNGNICIISSSVLSSCCVHIIVDPCNQGGDFSL